MTVPAANSRLGSWKCSAYYEDKEGNYLAKFYVEYEVILLLDAMAAINYANNIISGLVKGATAS